MSVILSRSIVRGNAAAAACREDNPMQDIPTKIVLNEKTLAWPAACKVIKRGTSSEAIVAAGGLLLKAAIHADALLLHIQPNYVNGQRTYHYNMKLPADSVPMSGSINPSGSMSLIFGPEALDHPPLPLRHACISVARALVEGGLDERYALEPISQMALREVEAFEAPPTTIGELAASAIIPGEE